MSYMGGNSRARVNPNAPEAFAVCDRCGKIRNHIDLVWQHEYRGNQLVKTGSLVCPETCLDKPAEFLRTVKLPADPVPIKNPRPSNFIAETIPNRSVQQIIEGD